LIVKLTDAGIGTGIYYPRTVFDYDCYRNRPDVIISPVPKAESAANSVLSIPVHPSLTNADLEYIVDTMKKLWA
jgi:dTDP-4-amino-4,6-dideoxygalactose transaminase